MNKEEFLTTEELVERIAKLYECVFAPREKYHKGDYYAGNYEYEFCLGFIEGVLAMAFVGGSEEEGIEELRDHLNKELLGEWKE